MKILKEEKDLIAISKLVALLSFVFGSILFLIFYLTENTIFMLLGIIYLFATFVVNSVFLVKLILQYSKSEDKRGVKLSVIVVLLNIPIAYCYYLLAMQIFSRIIELL